MAQGWIAGRHTWIRALRSAGGCVCNLIPMPLLTRHSFLTALPVVTALLFLAMLPALSGCSSGRLESTITQIEPTELFSGRETQLTFTGRFYSQLTLNSLTGQTSESWTYSGSLLWVDGPEPAPNQTIYPLYDLDVSATTLTATVKEGLPPGRYALALLDPAGYAVAVKTDTPITVPDRQADHIELTAPSRFMLAGNRLDVQVQVVYPDGSPATGAWDVELRLSNSSATFFSSTLSDPVQQTLEGDNGSRSHELRGKVDANGFATVTLANETPESFTLSSHSPELNHFISDTMLELVVLPTGYVGLSVVIPKDSSMRDPCLESEVEADETPHRPTGENIAVMVEAVDASGGRVEVDSEFELLDVEDEGPAPYFPPTLNLSLDQGCWDGILIYEAPRNTWLLAVGPDATYGFSPELVIETGPPRAYTLRLDSDRTGVEAGVPFSVIALQHDGYDNPVVFTDGMIVPTLSDSTGTLECAATETVGAEAHFTGCVITQAITQTELVASNGAGALGTLTLPVQSGPPSRIDVTSPASSIPAGTEQGFTLQLMDAYDNPVQDLSGADALEVQLIGLELPAEAPIMTDLVRGTSQVVIPLTQAGTWRLEARLASLSLSGQSQWFEVEPNTLSGFRVTPCVELNSFCSFTAGVPGQVLIQARDAYDNLISADPGPFSLSSPLESLDPALYTYEGLGGGEAILTPTLTRASSAYTLVVTLLSDAEIASESPPFEVVAGAKDHLEIQTLQPVYWASEVFEVRVLATDAWNNHVASVKGAILLEDQTGSLTLEDQTYPGSPVMVQLNEGEALVRLRISSVATSNKLLANGQGLSGRSAQFAVYNRLCSTQLTTVLSANGASDVAVACILERPGGEDVPASVTFSGTASGPVQAVVWDVGEGPLKSVSKLVPYTYAYSQPGRYRATLYAVDSTLCAAQDDLYVYTNFDNQSPAGPLLLSALQDPLLAGGAEDSSQTRIDVQAFDCQGDLSTAPYGMTLQTTLGAVLTADSDTSQAGVQVTLNRRGTENSFLFGVADERYSGTARVLVSTSGTTATGSLDISVLNDLTPPFVIQTLPSGRVEDPVSVIQIRFSEPLRAGSALMTPEILVESDRTGLLPLASRTTSADFTVLNLTLTSPLTWQAGPEVITITLPSAKGTPSLTDIEGNRLDGDWNGVADAEDPFLFRFGSALHAPTPAELLDCLVTPDTFSPDGQNGPGTEADWVQMDVYYPWTIPPRAAGLLLQSTLDGSTAQVMLSPVEAPGIEAGALLSWTWDGRDLLGFTLRNAGYRLIPILLDDVDNWVSTKCTVEDTWAILSNSIDVGGEW